MPSLVAKGTAAKKWRHGTLRLWQVPAGPAKDSGRWQWTSQHYSSLSGRFFSLFISFQTGEKLELRYSIISSARWPCASSDSFSDSGFCSDLHSLTSTSLLVDPVA